jgi:hypothetical protein
VISPREQSVEAGSPGTRYRTWVKAEVGQTPATQDPVGTRGPILRLAQPGVDDLGEVTDRTDFAVDGFSCLRNSCTSIETGRHTVTATFTGDENTTTISGEATLDVRPGPAVQLVLDPAQSSIHTGESQHYVALGYDRYGNPVPSGAIRPRLTIDDPDGSCSGTNCTSSKLGSHTVTGTAIVRDKQTRRISGTATLRVGVGAPKRIVLDPGTDTIAAGARQIYKAVAYDDRSNTLGDLAEVAIFAISPDGSCERNVCTATRPGEHTVTATLPVDRVSATAILRVVPGDPAVLFLFPSTGAITPGASMPYEVIGYDAEENRLGSLAGRSTLIIEPEGSCTGISCTATKPGKHVVTATLVGSDLRAQANLDVKPAPVAALSLRPRSSTIGAGGSRTYTVWGFDQSGFLGDMTAKATLTITPEGSCTRTSCTATRPGAHVVTAKIPGTPITAEAGLYVEPGRVARLALDPVGSSIGAGGSQTYSVRGFDVDQNELGDLTSRASFSIAPEGSCARATCTATEPGAHTVTAAVSRVDGGDEISTQARLEVVPARPTRLTLDPPTASRGAGAGQPYTVRAVDTAGNNLGDVTAGSTFAITPDGSCTGNVCTAAKPGRHTVNARLAGGGSDGEADGTATLNVSAATPARLVLNPRTSSVTAGTMQDYQMRGYDARGNDLGDFTAKTRFTIRPDGWCVHSQCTSRTAGDHTVSGAVLLPNAARGAGASAQLVSDAALHIGHEAGSSLIRLFLNALTWFLAAGAVLLAAGRWIRRRKVPPPRPAPDDQPQPEAVHEQVRTEIGSSTLVVRTEPNRGDQATRSVRVQTRNRRRTACTRNGEGR